MSRSQAICGLSTTEVATEGDFVVHSIVALENGQVVLAGRKKINFRHGEKGYIEIWDPAIRSCVSARFTESELVWNVVPLFKTDPNGNPIFATFENYNNVAVYRFRNDCAELSPYFVLPVCGIPTFLCRFGDANITQDGQVFNSKQEPILPLVFHADFNELAEVYIHKTSIKVNSGSQYFFTSPNWNYYVAPNFKSDYMELSVRAGRNSCLGMPTEEYRCGVFYRGSKYAIAADCKIQLNDAVHPGPAINIAVNSKVHAMSVIPDRYDQVVTSHLDGSVRIYDLSCLNGGEQKLEPAEWLIPTQRGKVGQFFSDIRRNIAVVQDEKGHVQVVGRRRTENKINFIVLASYVDVVNELLSWWGGIRPIADLAANYAGFFNNRAQVVAAVPRPLSAPAQPTDSKGSQPKRP